ncbi:MAG TPA: shikimate dehydrogenase [Nitrospirota bacterium]|nr:shikimate dehydrogenase [Nitrospirota bacterium]
MISGSTAVYGIFGYPVKHTFSPGMQNTAFQALGIDACYLPFPVRPETLGEAVRSMRVLGIQGLNITVPHKELVIPHLDELSEEARFIGAVNTIEVREGKLVGHNTDGRGFLRSLRDDARFRPKGKRFLFIGSGGAARAVGFSLALAGAAWIRFIDLDRKKAGVLAGDIGNRTGADAIAIEEDALPETAQEADALINATPLGLKRTDPLPLSPRHLRKGHLVCDLVYNPPETPLLKAARSAGAKRLPGLGMLLFQGVIAFEIWTGRKAPVDKMRTALKRQIQDIR